ncbi:hypothetical protein ACWATR_35170 [Nostoc sp. UIC 10890]
MYTETGTHGSVGEVREIILPIDSNQNHAPSSSVSATGTVRGWGAMLSNLWQKLGDR